MHLLTQENGREICNYCYLKVHLVDYKLKFIMNLIHSIFVY